MHILHIIGSMSPAAGGPTEVVRMLVQLAPPGYTAEVLTLDDPGTPTPVPTHALGPVSSTFGYTPKLIPWLRANRHRFDGVIVHGLWQFIGFAALRTLAGRVPYLVFPHGMLDPYFKKSFPLKHLKKLPYWVLSEYWLLRRAHRVLFTTATERDLAAQSFWLHRWTALVVALGTEQPPPPTPAAREAFFSLCPRVRERRFLLYLGRIDPKKGCDLLIQAFATVAPRDPGLDLVMAGPDSAGWRGRLQTLATQSSIADRVHWPGMVQGEAKLGAFDLCEAFILPSHQENFGVAVVEALAASRPVLISNRVNIAPEISTDACGYVGTDDTHGTTNLLNRWIETSPQTRHAMRLNAADSFRDRYDMRRNAEVILKSFPLPGEAY